jgi:xanthine dehydrogenase YagR molybdenum-binding subunit
LPASPPAGGSTTAPSVGSAVHIAATNIKSRLIELAVADSGSALFGAQPGAIDLLNGKLMQRAAPQRAETVNDLLRRNGYGPGHPLEVEGKYAPPAANANPFSLYGFGAQFCEVRVDADLGLVRIERMLGVFSGGRVLNAKTARSQLIGGMTGGIGMALLEETRIDPRMGRIVNANIADYLMPVNADIRNIDAMLIEEVDAHINPIGAKGLGELPIIGVAAAIANAVYNATGVRVRELPIKAEKIIEMLKR